MLSLLRAYDEDGGNRRENITDWALARFRAQYGDDTITKWDIFLLRLRPAAPSRSTAKRYQANLKRDLPRIPFAPDFPRVRRGGRAAGARSTSTTKSSRNIRLRTGRNAGAVPLDWRVEKMRLSKDKTQLRYNGFLTLDGIPAEAFGYRLGNRSALEWVIDQYRVKTDKRSGIVNDPNRG